MTREEAIKRLSKYVNNGFYTIEHQETCAMAIAALREQGGSFQNGNDHNTVKDWPPYLDLPREQENVTKCHDLYDEDGGEILAQESLEKKTSDSKTSNKETSKRCGYCRPPFRTILTLMIDPETGEEPTTIFFECDGQSLRAYDDNTNNPQIDRANIKFCPMCGRRLEDV